MALLPLVTATARWDEQAVLARRISPSSFLLEKHAYLAQSAYTNAVFFDYNNDSLLDLLIVGRGGDWNIKADVNILQLYRNLGAEADYRLEKVTDTRLMPYTDEGYYNPVSVGDINHDGYSDLLMMTYHSGRHIDVYLNDNGTGHFIRQESLCFDGATNGSCMLGDIDGDGWLDIEYSGYSDQTATCLKLYHNRHDGTFHDCSQNNVTGAFQGGSALADINGDGWLDIIATGNGNNWVCLATLYIAQGDGTFTSISENQCGILGVSRATPLVADLNADGLMDIVLNGEPSDGSGFRTRIYYQRNDGTFMLDKSYPVIPVNQDGGINMADADADGNMDLIVGGWTGSGAPAGCYSSPLRVYENHPETIGMAGNTRPYAPTSVSAVISGDSIIISWTAGSDAESSVEALRYNFFVRCDNTGETYTLIPADTETGRLHVGTDLQTSLSSRSTHSTMRHFGEGQYTVGVQTLDQAYAPSTFKTVTVNGTNGIEAIHSPSATSSAPRYYRLSGQPCRPLHGLYIEQTSQGYRKLIRITQ